MRYFAVFELVFVLAVLAPVPIRGQTIQLPTQRVFGAATTVWVPDGGSTYLGGIGQSQYGADSRGTPLFGKVPLVDRLFRNRAIGSSTGSSGLAVHVAIHDQDAMDRAVLDAAGSQGGEPSTHSLLIARKATQISHGVSLRRAVDGGSSLQAIRREQEQRGMATDAEAADLLDQGRQALQNGKSGLAKIYLQMAAKRGRGHVVDQARQLLDEIYRAKLKPDVVANASPDQP